MERGLDRVAAVKKRKARGVAAGLSAGAVGPEAGLRAVRTRKTEAEALMRGRGRVHEHEWMRSQRGGTTEAAVGTEVATTGGSGAGTEAERGRDSGAERSPTAEAERHTEMEKEKGNEREEETEEESEAEGRTGTERAVGSE